MIGGPLALLVAGALAALAVRRASTATIVRRAGGVDASVHRVGRPALPDVTSRWWPLVAAVLGWVLGGPIAAGIAVVGAIGGSTIVRRRRSDQLAAKLDEQLGDAVRALAAGLRAGLSVAQSIAYVADEGDPPLSTAFRRAADGIALGEGLDRTLERWAVEVGSDDARLVVGVLALHRKSGGDLPRVLDQVAETLRERTSAAQEVRSLTAQARLSGAILGLLPVGFFVFLWMTSRSDIEGAFHAPAGIAAIVLGLLLEALAFLWIRRLLVVT
jgi:tight adherence protein B